MGWSWTHYTTKNGLELLIFYLLSAGVTGVHLTHLTFSLLNYAKHLVPVMERQQTQMEITGLSRGEWANGSQSWPGTNQQQTGRAHSVLNDSKWIVLGKGKEPGKFHAAWHHLQDILQMTKWNGETWRTGHDHWGQWGRILQRVELLWCVRLLWECNCAHSHASKTHWKQTWLHHLSNVASQHSVQPEFYTQMDYPTVDQMEIFSIKNEELRARELACQLGVRDALTKDTGLIPSTHLTIHKYL